LPRDLPGAAVRHNIKEIFRMMGPTHVETKLRRP
jgi:hypothetical protein